MPKGGHWEYRTPAGTFRVVPRDDGYFVAMFEDEALEAHRSPEAAAAAIAGGETMLPSTGVYAPDLAVPEELCAWSFVRSR